MFKVKRFFRVSSLIERVIGDNQYHDRLNIRFPKNSAIMKIIKLQLSGVSRRIQVMQANKSTNLRPASNTDQAVN